MGKFNGSLIKILVGASAIEDLEECTLTIDGETIDVTTKDSSGWTERLHGVKSWSMSGSGIIDWAATEGADEIYDDLVAGTFATFKFGGSAVSGHSEISGSGLYTNLEISAPKEDKVSFSFSIEGSGQLTKTTI